MMTMRKTQREAAPRKPVPCGPEDERRKGPFVCFFEMIGASRPPPPPPPKDSLLFNLACSTVWAVRVLRILGKTVFPNVCNWLGIFF